MFSLLAEAPALPLDEAGKYVAGAYVVFVVLLVVYVAIMGAKLQRIERELRELATFAEARANPGMPGREAEDMPGIDSAQPPAGSDRNLTPSGAGEGPAASSKVEEDLNELLSDAEAQRDEYLELAQRTKADSGGFRELSEADDGRGPGRRR